MKSFLIIGLAIVFLLMGYIYEKFFSKSAATSTAQTTTAQPLTQAQIATQIAAQNAAAQAAAAARFAQLTGSPAAMLGETGPQNPLPIITGIGSLL